MSLPDPNGSFPIPLPDNCCLAASLVQSIDAINDQRERVARQPVASSLLRCCADKISVKHRGRLVILLFGVVVPVASAQLLEMPQPRVPLTDEILLGTIAAGRAADAFTTHQFLVAGQDEASLPIWIACRQPNMWTYSTAVSIGQIQLTRLLIRRRHLRIARGFEVIHATFIWNTVVHNEEIIPGAGRRRLSHTRPNPCLENENQVF